LTASRFSREFCRLKRNRFSTDRKLFERFLETVFMVSGFDRLPLFERILQLETEFIETLGGDTISPFDTESDFKI
jgi:hypothetical protein